jgi:hypothetical protein
MDTLEVLNGTGHLTLTWDPTDPKQVEKARQEVENLRAAGYSFFSILDPEEDVIATGNGTLLVERITDPIRLPAKKKRKSVAVRPMAGG